MKLELDNVSSVVLGAWNPAIISPTWLVGQGIVSPREDEVEMKVSFEAMGSSIGFEFEGIEWVVSQNRLEAKARSDIDCGKCVAAVLKVLNHTPVRAIGSNFTFKCSRDEWPEELLPQLGDVQLNEDSDVLEAKWSQARQAGNHTVLRTEVIQSPEIIVVSFNFHRNCETASEAESFARDWPRDRSMAEQALGDIREVEITW